MVKVIDNTGALWVRCINILRHKNRNGGIGDIMVGAVKEIRQYDESNNAAPVNSKAQRVQKGQVVHGVIVRTRKESRRPDGTYVKFDDNACVLVDLDKKKGVIPKGTRIVGVVGQELRKSGMLKILSLAPNVV